MMGNRLPKLLAGLASMMPVFAGLCADPATGPDPAGAAEYRKDVLPLLQKYCYDCHGDGMDKGSVALDKYPSLSKHFEDHQMWLAVWKNLQSQLMPPAKKPQPTPEEQRILNNWIERVVFKSDPANPDPGRVTIRRLNREEYKNTIQDLLGVDFDTAEAFPADDTGYGFDTIGDVLNISPILLEKYVDAAEEIVREVMKDTEGRIPVSTVSGESFKSKSAPDQTGKWLPFANQATVESTWKAPRPGKYRITVDMKVAGSDEATVHSANLKLKANGKEVEKRNLGWDNRKSIQLQGTLDATKGNVRLSLDISEHQKPAEGENSLGLVINTVKIEGPLDGSFREYPKDYYLVFMDGTPPTEAAARSAYMQKVVRNLADRAFRRPVDEPMLKRLVNLAETAARQPGMTFEAGVGHALTAILASPRFLFRAEIQPEPNNPGHIVPIDEFALASRLSYFLWSSLPDEQLFTLAREKKLRANLKSEVERMLKDPKGNRFVRNFVGQWLQTRDVTTINVNAARILRVKNEDTAKYFGQNVRRAMRDETDMLFGYILKENRSALELLDSDYTFLNESLAKFYGIQGVKGTEMRKVSLKPENNRGSVLTHASFLVVTSNPTRTSPVKRGLFVLENILGTPAPPAPPNVPTLEEAKKAGNKMTMREMMVLHREKPLCAACHQRMDPIGLGLENFNALGMWRDQEDGLPIDSAGQLITGEKFNNVAELSKILASTRRMDFYRCISEKLLTYSLGRGPEYYDATTIEKLAEQLEADGGKLQNLVVGIVQSAPFQKRRGDGDQFATPKPVSERKKK